MTKGGFGSNNVDETGSSMFLEKETSGNINDQFSNHIEEMKLLVRDIATVQKSVDIQRFNEKVQRTVVDTLRGSKL